LSVRFAKHLFGVAVCIHGVYWRFGSMMGRGKSARYHGVSIAFKVAAHNAERPSHSG
jgi:hypothetical protein